MILEVTAFALFSGIAIAGALGMTTTMSMFRSGVFLMASFVGVAGLFLLLAADLIGLLQIMMYVGGMLVMIIFMVLFMMDPGGAMMAEMGGMGLVASFFSRGLGPPTHEPDTAAEGIGPPTDAPSPLKKEDSQARSLNDTGMDMSGMDMSDMSMTTPAQPYALWIAVTAGLLLSGLMLVRPSWRVVSAVPDPDSARRVGSLLMDKYMVGFEGAGLMILFGIFSAVYLARASTFRSERRREALVAPSEMPSSILDETLAPRTDRENGTR